MVIFQTPGGSPGYNQFETLDEAVSFVEQLRNDRDVANARIFALEEVKFEFKPYFKVELQALTAGSGTPAPAPAPVQAQAPQPERAAPAAPSTPAAPSAPQVAPAAPAPGGGAFNQPAPSEAPAPAPVASPAAAPAPPADQPAEAAPVRRGLFGR